MYLYAQPHPEVEEDQEAKRKDEEEKGGELVEWVVLMSVCLLLFFPGNVEWLHAVSMIPWLGQC